MKKEEKRFKNSELKKIDEAEPDEVFEVLVLYPHRAKSLEAKEARGFVPGETYKLKKGLDLLQVIGTGYCTLDLKAKVPANPKRRVSENGDIINNGIITGNVKEIVGASKYKDPVATLAEKIDTLMDHITKKK